MPMKAKDLDITNINHVQFLIKEIERSENKERKKDAWEHFQASSGNQRDYTLKSLMSLYPESWQNFRVGDISISKKVIDKKSKAYKADPIRELEKETESDAYNQIMKRDGFNRAWKEFDKIFNRDKYAVFWPSWVNPKEDEEEGHYSPMALAPFEYDLVRDEVTGKPLIFILSFPDRYITGDTSNTDGIDSKITENQDDRGASKKLYAFWSASSHTQVIRSVSENEEATQITAEFIKIDGNPENTNPIGRLPVAFASQDLSVDYPVPNNLGKQSIEWNVNFSDLKTAAAVQGHGQLVIKHPDGQKMKALHMGMHTAIQLPQSKKEGTPPTDASYINPGPDLSGQLEVLKFDAMNILDEHGIQAKGSISGGIEKFASGFDRLLSMADVQEIIEENQSIYSDVEQEVYQIIQATEKAKNKDVFKSESITVKYQKPKVMISDKETLENIKLRDELGLIEEWEKLVLIDPNLTEEMARDKLEKIKLEKEAKLKSAQILMGNSEQIEPEQDDEELEEDA